MLDLLKAAEEAATDLTPMDEVVETAFFLNPLASAIHALNEAWYRDPKTGEPIPFTLELGATKIALIHSEVSEMLEGLRKGKQDDHLPDRKAEEVEAADVLIRLLDYCAWRGLDIGGAVEAKCRYNAQRADHKHENRRAVGGKAF